MSREIEKVKLITLHNPNTGIEQKFALSLQILGQGKYAKVHRAVHLQDSSRVYAVKVIQVNSTESKDLCLKQLKIIQQLPKCPNLVYIHKEHLESEKNLYIFEEFCGGGSLHDYRLNRETPMTENQIFDMFFQIFNGFRSLQKAGIMHEDIKPNNILLKYPVENEQGGNIFKICDFGISQLETQIAFSKIRKGTISYMPPQKLKKPDYLPNAKSDIYSLGVTLYEVIFGRHPYLTSRVNDYRVYLKKISEVSLLPLHEALPKEQYERMSIRFEKFYRILERMIELSEAKRISLQQLNEYVETSQPFKNMSEEDFEKKEIKIQSRINQPVKYDIVGVSIIRHCASGQSQLSKPLLMSAVKINNEIIHQHHLFLKQAASYISKGLQFMKKSKQFETVQKEYSCNGKKEEGSHFLETKLAGVTRIQLFQFLLTHLSSYLMFNFMKKYQDRTQQEDEVLISLEQDAQYLKNQFFKVFSESKIENKKQLYEQLKTIGSEVPVILRMEFMELYEEILMVRVNFKEDIVALLFIKNCSHILMMLKMINDSVLTNQDLFKGEEVKKCEAIMKDFDSYIVRKRQDLKQDFENQIKGTHQIMFDLQENSDEYQMLDEQWLQQQIKKLQIKPR